MHNNENTEQGDGDEEANILESSSHLGGKHLGEALLNSYKGLLRIHLSLEIHQLWWNLGNGEFSRERDGKFKIIFFLVVGFGGLA